MIVCITYSKNVVIYWQTLFPIIKQKFCTQIVCLHIFFSMFAPLTTSVNIEINCIEPIQFAANAALGMDLYNNVLFQT